jgi:hypothetical protein
MTSLVMMVAFSFCLESLCQVENETLALNPGLTTSPATRSLGDQVSAGASMRLIWASGQKARITGGRVLRYTVSLRLNPDDVQEAAALGISEPAVGVQSYRVTPETLKKLSHSELQYQVIGGVSAFAVAVSPEAERRSLERETAATTMDGSNVMRETVSTSAVEGRPRAGRETFDIPSAKPQVPGAFPFAGQRPADQGTSKTYRCTFPLFVAVCSKEQASSPVSAGGDYRLLSDYAACSAQRGPTARKE